MTFDITGTAPTQSEIDQEKAILERSLTALEKRERSLTLQGRLCLAGGLLLLVALAVWPIPKPVEENLRIIQGVVSAVAALLVWAFFELIDRRRSCRIAKLGISSDLFFLMMEKKGGAND